MEDKLNSKREWKFLVEDWRGPLGLAHIDAWAQALSAEKERYSELQSDCLQSVNYWVSKWYTVRGCLSFLVWALRGFDRKYRASSGFIIGHHVVEFRLRSSQDGRFKGWSSSVLRTYVGFFKFSILSERLLSTGRYKVHLVTDEAYQGGVLAQVSQSLGIPTLKLRAYGEQLTIWPFNSHILFGGPDFHGVSLTTVVDEEIVGRVKRDLTARIDGDYSSLSYMSAVKKSKDVQLQTVENSVIFVMYLHDFLDSPGVYGETVFLDQWDWIHSAEREVSKLGGHLLLKLHSNQNPATDAPNEQVIRYVGKKSNVSLIDRNASLNQMWSTYSPKAVLTMYGSVILECACLKIPVIYTSHNPYVAFGFGFRATSKGSFIQALRTFGNARTAVMDEEEVELQTKYVADAKLRIDKLMNDCSLGDVPYLDIPAKKMMEFGFDIDEGSNIYDRIRAHNWRTNWGREHHLLYEYVKRLISESEKYQLILERFK